MEVTKADIVVKLRALRMALFDAADEIERLRAELAEATELVEDLTRKGCLAADGVVDSGGRSTYADALRWLAERGRFQIEHEHGDVVFGRWEAQ